MKKALFSLFVILCSYALYADQIFMSGGTVIKGKVLRITEHDVEYNPVSGSTIDTVEKSSIAKIVYDDGKMVTFRLDTLFVSDGAAVRGTIARITNDIIVYMPEGSREEKSLKRSDVVRIEYGDGRKVEMDGAEEKPGRSGKQRHTGGFTDAWVRINGFFAVSDPRGGIIENEQKLFKSYRPDLLRAYIIPKDYHLRTTVMGGGGELDVMPPAVHFAQKRTFDFTGIKFGIRGRYGFEFADSAIVDEGVYSSSADGYEQFRGKLMSYHYWAAGPVMNLIFSPRNNLYNFIINVFAVAGQVLDGQVKAAAALRSARQLQCELAGMYGFPAIMTALAPAVIGATRYANRAAFQGYTVRVGLGPHFSVNRCFPIIFGVNVTYAYSRFVFKRVPLVYFDGHRKSDFNEIGAEVSSGFHF